MKVTPIYHTLRASPAVEAVLGTHPQLRVYAFGEAPPETLAPYLTWQVVTGIPGNTLSCKPEYDEKTIQVDIYAETSIQAQAVVEAVTLALEEVAYITAWHGEARDRETGYYRVTFSVDWFVRR